MVEGTVSAISMTTSREEAVKSADLVIEAIVENLRIKQELFQELDKVGLTQYAYITWKFTIFIETLCTLFR